MLRSHTSSSKLILCSLLKRQFSTVTTPATKAPQKVSLSKLRSRRVANREKLQQQTQAEKSSSKTSKANVGAEKQSKKVDEKPWPKSVIYAAWAAGCTLVPYTCIWISLIIPPLREKIWVKDHRSIVPLRLRRHFGEEDWHSVAYPDVLNDEGIVDRTKVPYVLPGEAPVQQEVAWAEVEDRAKEDICVRLIPIIADTQDGGWLDSRYEDFGTSASPLADGEIVTLPASLPATNEQLMKHLSETIRKSNPSISMVAVDFPKSEKKDNEKQSIEISPNEMDETSTTTFSLDDGTDIGKDRSEAPKKDPLIGTIHTYSTWYYQAPMQHLTQSSSSSGSKKGSSTTASSTMHHVTASITDEEIQIQQLEADMKRLQAELRNLNATRSYDDIQDDLDQTRASLRRLKWKRWRLW